jgi:hypothetical protein
VLQLVRQGWVGPLLLLLLLLVTLPLRHARREAHAASCRMVGAACPA